MMSGVSSSHHGAILTGAVLLVVALAAAVSVDVVQTTYDIKGDEATYVAMTLSAAYDGDLMYQRRDLERFWGIYKRGPDGIFLKKGKNFRIRFRSGPPFLRVYNDTEEPRTDRLYFAKAMVHAIVAAPFVRLFGMNGLLVLNVLLLAIACVCGYVFLSATSPPVAALVFVLGFFGASVVPIYAVFLTPEMFNLALVVVAYFLWLFKEVRLDSGTFARPWTDWTAAVLLGVAAYMKPTNAPLIAP